MKYLQLYESHSSNYVFIKDVSTKPNNDNLLWKYITKTEFEETRYKLKTIKVDDIFNNYNDGTFSEIDGLVSDKKYPLPFKKEQIDKNKVYIINSKNNIFFNNEYYIILLRESGIKEISVVDISDIEFKEPKVYKIALNTYNVVVNNRLYKVWKNGTKLTNKRIGFVKNTYLPNGKKINRVKSAKSGNDWQIINLFTYIDNALVPPNNEHLK